MVTIIGIFLFLLVLQGIHDISHNTLAHCAPSIIGAFTPGCSARHLPGYIDNLSKIKSKGVDIVAVIAFNDAWVMSAWGKANGIKGDDIVSERRHPTCRMD